MRRPPLARKTFLDETPPDDLRCWYSTGGPHCGEPASATYRTYKGTEAAEISVCETHRKELDANPAYDRVAQFDGKKRLAEWRRSRIS